MKEKERWREGRKWKGWGKGNRKKVKRLEEGERSEEDKRK